MESVFLGLVFSSALGLVLGGVMSVSSHKSSVIRGSKFSPFECGFLTKSPGRLPFSIQFFLIALIFLIFDMELILLFPYMNKPFLHSGAESTIMLVFLFLLTLSLLFEWSQKMLEWVK